MLYVDPPPAIIYVDGQEFIRCVPGDDYREIYQDTVDRVGGEVALCVWKARYQGYLREKLSWTASKI
jgi:hypothetical protein